VRATDALADAGAAAMTATLAWMGAH